MNEGDGLELLKFLANILIDGDDVLILDFDDTIHLVDDHQAISIKACGAITEFERALDATT